MTDNFEPSGPTQEKDSKPQSNSLLAKTFRRMKSTPAGAFFVDLVVIVASALVLSLIIKTFLLRSFFIPSGSMESTLQINDRIIVNELVPNVIPLQRGDVVVFKDPGGWLYQQPETPQTNVSALGTWITSVVGLSAPDSSQHLVKRVIGIGGDHVVCCNTKGQITINGVAINETYLDKGTSPSLKTFDVTVPKDSFWVMGDNRGNSEDSRFHTDLPGKGFVPKSAVVGRAFVLSWPFSRWKWLDDFANVFKTSPTTEVERQLIAAGSRFVIGVDEVGRGAIAGPVAVGVAILDSKETDLAGMPAGLRDSKLLSENQRVSLIQPIENWVAGSAVGFASPLEIDTKGIVVSLALAASRALTKLLETEGLRASIAADGATILLDGSHNWLQDHAGGLKVVVKTKADRDCAVVAAASVVAKVQRDDLMVSLASDFGAFGFDGHKGYASSSHIAALQKHGPSEVHRKTWLTRILAQDALPGLEAGLEA